MLIFPMGCCLLACSSGLYCPETPPSSHTYLEVVAAEEIGQCHCRFTAWMGQNSSFGKQKRLLQELHTRMSSSGHISTDRTALRLFYLPTLRTSILAPLRAEEKQGDLTSPAAKLHTSAPA